MNERSNERKNKMKTKPSDTRLIAAAPDMFAILKALNELLSNGTPVYPGALLKDDQSDETTIEHWIAEIIAKVEK